MRGFSVLIGSYRTDGHHYSTKVKIEKVTPTLPALGYSPKSIQDFFGGNGSIWSFNIIEACY
jgi:hypothetical protein